MITEEYDENLFISRFEDYNRVSTPASPNGNFSYKGLRALFAFIDDFYTKENPYKMDVIALCCEFAEYGDIEEYITDYLDKDFIFDNTGKKNLNKLDDTERDVLKDCIEEEINNKTILIKLGDDLDDGFIIGEC